MKKFIAKVRFKGKKDPNALIRAFLNEFNPGSSIDIKDGEGIMVGTTDGIPEETIEIITSFCKVDEFYCEEDDSEQADETATEEDDSEQVDETAAEKDDSEQVDETAAEKNDSVQPKKRRGRPPKKKVEDTKDTEKKLKSVDIPELKEIAQKATSFEEFADLVSKWLEMGSRHKCFNSLAISSTEIPKISWKNLEERLKTKGLSVRLSDRNYISQRISEKLHKYSVKTLQLLKEISKYKDFSFKQEEVTQDIEEFSTSAEISSDGVNLNEPYDLKTPGLEQLMKSVNKTQSVELRVARVLAAMGENTGVQRDILMISIAAVKLKSIYYDAVMSKANISEESSKSIWMTLSEFINNFTRKYNSDKKVKVLDFLKDLQKIVLSETEIQNL